MQRFRIHLSVNRDDSFPPVDTLPEVEAESALDALQAYVEQPRVEPQVIPKLARAILTLHPNGLPRHVLSVPIYVHETIPLKWTLTEQ